VLAEKIWTFLSKHLLHWIEAMSLMKMLDGAYQSLIHLEHWLKVGTIIYEMSTV
jgi:hypothetical protein